MLKAIALLVIAAVCSGQESEKEYPPYDGWYNNRAHPEWGVVDMPLTRRLPSHYQDGVYLPSGWKRPNPRTISEELMKGDTGKNSYLNKTAFMVFFGQQVVEEILDAQRPGCPPEYFNIPIPKNDSLYDKDVTGTAEIPLLRSRYQQAISGYSPNFPRQQLNEITSYIDGGLTYGVNKAWADALRLHDHCESRTSTSNIFSSTNPSDCRGELASLNDTGRLPIENNIGLPLANPPPPRDHELKKSTRFYRLGNPRGNENPFLLTFGVLWFRYHNWLAKRIRESHSDYSDEKVFNEARVLNIATHQRIVFYEWLPIFLGLGQCDGNDTCGDELPEYKGYKSSIHPGITHIFQSAAMRFGHTLVPPGVFRRTPYDKATNSCQFMNTTMFTAGERHSFQEVHVDKPALRTCNTYWNSIEAVSENDASISNLLMGMASQLCEREDNIITPDLRGSVFGPLEFSRRDLMAINIQRARDHGLPDYNTARDYLGLGRKDTFEAVNPELFNDTDRNGPELLEKFVRVHDGNIENVDIWTGGLLETTKNGPGELFSAVILDQFVRIRDGDRFWFENRLNGLLSDDDLEFVWNTTIKDVVLRTNPELTEDDIQDKPFIWDEENDPKTLCPQPFALSEIHMEECTKPETFDYFSGSEVSFALSFAAIGFYAFLMLLLLILLGKTSQKNRKEITEQIRRKKQNIDDRATIVEEILGKNDRQIQILLGPGKTIQVKSIQGARLRSIGLDPTTTVSVQMSTGGNKHVYDIQMSTETYDLVLSFNDSEERNTFNGKFKDFLKGENISLGPGELLPEKHVLEKAVTKEKRDKMLKNFYCDVLAALAKIDTAANTLAPTDSRKYAKIELSKKEFSEYLKLKTDSMFMDQIFQIADRDQNGFISYREFMNVMWIFSKGTADDKAQLMFDMYDLNRSGHLTMDEFKLMLRSTMDMVNADVEESDVDDLVARMLERHGFSNRTSLSLKDFQTIMSQYSGQLNDASFEEQGASNRTRADTVMHQQRDTPMGRRVTTIQRARQTAKAYAERHSSRDSSGTTGIRRRATIVRDGDISQRKTEPENDFQQLLTTVQKYTQNYRTHIFWLTTYIIVALAIFAERVYYYSVEREHAGLKRICGYGVSVTRGAASGMMFTYSSLLVTMSRNTVTLLRETFLHHYIPFDSAVSMHRHIAWLAMIFTAIHIIGHSVNFYSIATQPASDLGCLFPDYWRTSDALPKFHYWCWQTITGITGVICTLIVITMYVFASDYSRRLVFRWFWWTHNFGYVLLYLFMILHGSGFLVQPPFFYYFFLGPAVLYTLDKLYSISRNRIEISVIKAELLPSEVTYLEFKRPTTFDYKAGQWVRIACLAQSHHEYHPFTLTSCPSEETLKVHIRAVGPWTMNLRRTYHPDVLQKSSYPKLYLDGPFGEGHQDWYKYDVSVLVGGGIGVTPFASILKDLIHKSASGMNIRCKKVFFLWTAKDQKQFEWLTDIIEEVENSDVNDILDTHIFITQIPSRFDFRTIMLYICERNFQKLAEKSLFTGLRAITHFGRPNFKSLFRSLKEEYPQVDQIGVFSCGPPPMTQSVDVACAHMNRTEGTTFLHHFENF